MKILFNILFVLFLSQNIEAQIISKYGLKSGLTITSLKWENNPYFKFDNKNGFNLGIFAEFLNYSFFNIVAELNYTQKGFVLKTEITSNEHPEGTGEFQIHPSRTDYLNSTILGKIKFSQGDFRPYLIVGPKFDFEIYNNDKIFIIQDDFAKFIPGLKVGLGTEFTISKLNFLTELLYDANFIDLYEENNLKITSSSIDIRVGIIF
jgi:hypothetical protein